MMNLPKPKKLEEVFSTGKRPPHDRSVFEYLTYRHNFDTKQRFDLYRPDKEDKYKSGAAGVSTLLRERVSATPNSGLTKWDEKLFTVKCSTRQNSRDASTIDIKPYSAHKN